MLIYDKWDLRFIKLAEHVSEWSKDPSTKVGAIIAKDKKVVSLGYNGFPIHIADTEERLSIREVKLAYTIHAEINAILSTEKSLQGCTLYTWPFMPCARCACQIIQSGIVRVVSLVSDNKLWEESFDKSKSLFKEARVTLCLLDGYGKNT